MQTLSSLSQLSHAEKDALILKLQEQITALQGAVRKMQSRLNTGSRNSSKPPSSDGLNKPRAANIFEALVASFKGAPPQPSFG